jgi:Pentapeptide repeats (8 copies)
VFDEEPQRPTSGNDRTGWAAYWRALGLPWRTEPEIDELRQQYLAERRKTITPDLAQGSYPFKGVEPKLTRADIEWLLATHEDERGPVVWHDEKEKPYLERQPGLDLRGADLHELVLTGLPLSRLRGGLDLDEWVHASPEQRASAAALLHGAILEGAHLEDATLIESHLEAAMLSEAHLAYARLRCARLERAVLERARLTSTDLRGAHLEDATLGQAHLESATLEDAHLEGATLTETHLEAAALSRAHLEGKRLASKELTHLAAAVPEFPDQ